MTTLKAIVTHSVFRPIPKGTAMDSVLAMLFHRSAATLYALYALWALIALFMGFPSIEEGLGRTIGNLVFPVLVLSTTIPAGVGATFWPNMARLELFAGSAFAMTMLIYVIFAFVAAFNGSGTWQGAEILLTILIIPVARTVIVIVLLLRQAEDRKIQGV